MDIITTNPTIHLWLIHYGSFALFILLAMGIIALPVPEETLMVLAGVLMQAGHLPFLQIILAAYLGSLCGITVSYLLGRSAGHLLVDQSTKWIGQEYTHSLEKAQSWFKRFGKWALFFGYFIPGFRHFIGVFAGMSDFRFNQFALFAYSGAAIWVSTYLSLGYFSGHYWLSIYENIFKNIETSIETIGIATILAFVIYLIYRSNK